MADKVPLKLVDNGSGVGSLVEFAVGDTVPAANLTKAIAVALTGLVAGTNTAIVVTDTILSALQNLQAQTTAAIAYRTGSGYIDGLVPVWNSSTSISVTSGSAYVPGLGSNLAVPATLTLSSLSLTASTWHYLYLYSNAGVPAIELVTTAPDVAYSGTSRTKVGDIGRRFVGALLSNASGGLWGFEVDSSGILNLTNDQLSAPFVILAGGTSQALIKVATSSVVPITTRTYKALLTNGNSSSGSNIAPNTTVARMINIPPNGSMQVVLALNPDRTISYYNGSPGGLFYIQIAGYGNDR